MQRGNPNARHLPSWSLVVSATVNRLSATDFPPDLQSSWRWLIAPGAQPPLPLTSVHPAAPYYRLSTADKSSYRFPENYNTEETEKPLVFVLCHAPAPLTSDMKASVRVDTLTSLSVTVGCFDSACCNLKSYPSFQQKIGVQKTACGFLFSVRNYPLW